MQAEVHMRVAVRIAPGHVETGTWQPAQTPPAPACSSPLVLPGPAGVAHGYALAAPVPIASAAHNLGRSPPACCPYWWLVLVSTEQRAAGAAATGCARVLGCGDCP